MTDTFAAANEGLKRGCSFFYIYCGTGGEIDHTLANIQTLIYLSGKNKRVFLFDGVKVITAVSGGGKICFSDKARGRISVLCAGSESLGVDIRGLLYEASSLDLKNSFPLGARNEFTGKESSVFVKQGCLLIVFDSDAIKHMI